MRRCILLISIIISCQAIREFPRDFLFGTASSAFQYEGAWNEDGKGSSIWDVFNHEPYHIIDDSTADVACDSYHLYQEDIAIMKDLGLKAYRFSIAWTRIFPNGTPTKIDQAGIDYYINVFKTLKEAGIEPVVTIFHWDLPEYLEQLGGWMNPRIADYIGQYARICFKHFGQYVKYWVTLNEPSTNCIYGYEEGDFAPGLKLPGEGAYQCAYTHVLSHATIFHIYNNEFRRKQRGLIGFNNMCFWFYAKSNSTEDIAAQIRALEFYCGLFANPIFNGDWPEVVKERVAYRSWLEGYNFSRLPEFTPQQKRFIKGSADYFALNAYSSYVVEPVDDDYYSAPSLAQDSAYITSTDPSWLQSSDTIVSDPNGIRSIINFVNDRYNPKEIFITENGWPDNGGLEDNNRITYLNDSLSGILNSMLIDGVNVKGYTMLDNFEWVLGYTVKYGIVQVDFDSPNRTRTLKKSAAWYKKVVTTGKLD
ncbi:myrosinase 1-like [Rhynchophorus ferrugineus]|uniref:myrosinase 1-like n=1 Tax=Rhynchophorus ferrugineus TaxID=354439 RepID=UPI003FCCCE5A